MSIPSLTSRGQEILDLTLKLVSIPSTSRTQGELKIARFIHTILQSWPYFQQYPERLSLCPVAETGKLNVLALVRGEKAPSDRTLVYLGHMDTVDIKEYKSLEDVACDPMALARRLEITDLPREVAEDLASGEWLFGRGTADMKTGVAIFIRLLEEVAQTPETFCGNLVLAIVCDEEADSQGMLSLARPLSELADKEGLDLIGAINTDVVSQMDGGSRRKRHIYLGSMGKIVPGVFVVGKGSHVGESLQGFDANQLLSRLTWLIDANMSLADSHQGCFTHPPVSLKQADLKTDYNGQVPFEGYAYYNMLNFKRGASKVLEQIRELTVQAFEDCLARLELETRIYFEKNQVPAIPFALERRVLSFSQLCTHVQKKQGPKALEQAMDQVRRSFGPNPELRAMTLAMVRAIWLLSGLSGPAAVLFIMPPYYPANDPEFDHPKFQCFNRRATQALHPIQTASSYDIHLDQFFPFISDASFCAYTEDWENRAVLKENMPCWRRGWAIDLDMVRKLNLPVLDMGAHGKDFHKRFERVHVPYSMDALPEMIQQVTRDLLRQPYDQESQTVRHNFPDRTGTP